MILAGIGAGIGLFAGLLGCAPMLGPARVGYGESVPIPIVQPSTDPRRWYVPMSTASLGPVVWFVDTGYTYSTCDDTLVDALGLEPRGRVRIRGELGHVRAKKVRLPAFELGGHRVGPLACQVRDLGATSSLDDPREVPIAGVIGMDVLRRFRVVIDPALAVIELHDPRGAPPLDGPGLTELRRAGLHGLRARMALELPLDRSGLQVEAREVWQILDTGATNTYVDGERIGLVPSFTHENVTVRGTGRTGRVTRQVVSYTVERAEVGGQPAGATVLIDRDRRWWEPGLLGVDLLSRFRQEYDFARGVAQLERVDPRPIPQFSSYWLGTGGHVPARLLDEPPDAASDSDR